MSELARKRWVLLGNILHKGRCRVNKDLSAVSVRRFASFNLVQTSVMAWEDMGLEPEVDAKGHRKLDLWYKYTCSNFPEFTAEVRHLDGSFTMEDILGFNNTGNVCVWPAEEVLLYYCLANRADFRGKRVIELGGGMTCVAGLALALCGEAEEILLTDGNKQSINNVDVIVERNKSQFGGTKVTSRTLVWNEHNQLDDLFGYFDSVICADCLFFDEYREDLAQVIHKLLRPRGSAIILAPNRNQTFWKFKEIAEPQFGKIVTFEKYDEIIWNLHLENKVQEAARYDEDLHYPLLMKLHKTCEETLDS